MNSGMFDSGNAFGSDWDSAPDASEFLYDSPVPHNQDLFSLSGSSAAAATPGNSQPSGNANVKQEPADDKARPHLSVPNDTTSQPSSTSASDSRSSSSQSPAQAKHSTSTSPPMPSFNPSATAASDLPSHAAFGKMDGMFGEDDQGFVLDSTFPSVNSDMDHLSLNTGGGFDFGAAPTPGSSMDGIFTNDRDQDMTPRTLGAIKNAHSMNASPQQMTVSPQKMFSLESREESPNDIPMNSGQSSPFPLTGSPIGGNLNAFGGDYSNNDTIASKMGAFSGAQKTPAHNASLSNDGSSATSAAGLTQPAIAKRWPCELLVDPTPEKSRVETQIPIRLTLRNPPPGFHRLHLPAYTISKPKFQQKPPFEGDDESLELSVLLVCASAMQQKEGALERAFKRAEIDDVPVRTDDSPSSNQDENDPDRPLNGGPVAICPGCIVRERKRANRKKNKKQEEEEEWQKDEAKRVIVFNCQEIKDWCVHGTKESPVKDHNGPVDAMFVNVPMRIACYCRHQSEKVGFQVIFTIRRPGQEILAQGISQSIMITDDHKQPPPSAMQGMPFAQGQQLGSNVFQPNPQFPVYSHSQNYAQSSAHPSAHSSSDLPYRPTTSASVPNLSQMGQQYAQHQQSGFPRQFSSNNLSSNMSSGHLPQSATSGSATPRTLSRPASPTNPSGQPGTKKRKSGGSGHNKVPSGLSMTRIDTKRSPPPSNGPLTAASSSAGFNFQSPTSSSFATTPLDGAFPQPQHARNTSMNHPFQGQLQPYMTGFTPNENDMSQFYSAPTSQHHSRAPSPSSASRFPQHPQQGFPQHLGSTQSQMQAMQGSIPSQTAAALSNLPPGLNLQRPPIIQRLIPAQGLPRGGEEVTILGSGFFQGLDVMFGDAVATDTTLWADTTLVCRAPPLPPGHPGGVVNVVFRHQHPQQPNNVEAIPALMPTRPVQWYYLSAGYINGNSYETVGGYSTGGSDPSPNPLQMNPPQGLGSASGAGSPISGSPGMDDGGMAGIQGMARNFFAQGTSPAPTPSRQQLGSGSAGFNAAAQARRQPLSRTVSGDASAFRRAG